MMMVIMLSQLRGWLKGVRMYKAACEFMIVCESPADDVSPFPHCHDTDWGPGCVVDRYGLVPAHRSALLAAPDGRAEISFTRQRPVRLHARLNSERFSAAQLENCVSVGEYDHQVSKRIGPVSK